MDARYTALPHAPATRERQLHQPQAARVLLDSLKEVLTSIFGERCEPWLAAPLGRAPTPAEVDVLAAAQAALLRRVEPDAFEEHDAPLHAVWNAVRVPRARVAGARVP